jgi:ABC-2 type transport system ATP-binding protein
MRISIEHLSKVYPHNTQALKDLTLSIEGGMFGLLGPNGAGKTTLMRILVTLMDPTAGKVSIGGLDLRKDRAAIRALLGYLPQELDVFPKLKTWEFLDYNARLAGMMNSAARKRAVNELLDRVRLAGERDRLCNDLSGGMKRRLGIAQALIGSPKLLVVDEPTAGLDPEERLRFRNLLAELGGDDVTIILSTHIVGDISSSCGDMAMLHKGEIVYRGAPEGLVAMVHGHAWTVTVPRTGLDDLKKKYPVISSVPNADGWDVQVVADRLEGYEGTPIEPNLEHAYVYFHEFLLGKTNGTTDEHR